MKSSSKAIDTLTYTSPGAFAILTTLLIVNSLILLPSSNQILADTSIPTNLEGQEHFSYAIAVNERSNTVYVTHHNANVVSIINASSNTIIDTIQTTFHPVAVAVNPNTGFAYIGIGNSAEVVIVDGSTNGVALTLNMSAGAHQYSLAGISVDKNKDKVYVLLNENAGDPDRYALIAVIDGFTNEVEQIFQVYKLLMDYDVPDWARGIAVNPITGMIYVTSSFGDLYAVNALSKFVSRIGLTEVDGTGMSTYVAVNEKTNKIFVSRYNVASVSVVDGATKEETTLLDVGMDPHGIAVDSESERIFVAAGQWLLVIDTASGTVRKQIKVGDSPIGVAFNSNDGSVYVANWQSDFISVVSSETITSYDPAGIECEVVGDTDELKARYREMSNMVISDWEIERITPGCLGSINVSYVLPISDSKTTYSVLLDIPAAGMRTGLPFTEDFVQNRNIVVAATIRDVQAEPIFKEARQELSKVHVSFYYGQVSPYVITGYKGSPQCTSRIWLDSGDWGESVEFTVTNDIKMRSSMPLLALSREYIASYLENYYNVVNGTAAIRPATDVMCGTTSGFGMNDCCAKPDASYTGYADVDCEGCPMIAQVHLYGNELPVIYTEKAADGSELKNLIAEGSALGFLGEFNSSISTSHPFMRNGGGRVVESARSGEIAIITVRAHNGVEGSLSCLVLLEVRDENGVTAALEADGKNIPQGNLVDAGFVWRPDKPGKYQLRVFVVSDLEEPSVLTELKTSDITVT